MRRVQLVALPSDASVEIDGAAAHPRDGVVAIDGKLGTVHRVRVFKGAATSTKPSPSPSAAASAST
jgi:hypothetical protein